MASATRQVEDGRQDRESAPAAPERVWSPVRSRAGLLGAGVFFSLSLFPSLLPRTSVTQGLISGVTIAIGYGIGSTIHWAWDYVGLPRMSGSVGRIVSRVVLGLVGFMIASK